MPSKDIVRLQVQPNKLLRFVSTFLLVIITGSIGLLFNGLFEDFYAFLTVLVVFSIIFFEFWEIKILCTHCPFYTEEGRVLDCYGNYGSLKVWSYNPEPMSKSEKNTAYNWFHYPRHDFVASFTISCNQQILCMGCAACYKLTDFWLHYKEVSLLQMF